MKLRLFTISIIFIMNGIANPPQPPNKPIRVELFMQVALECQWELLPIPRLFIYQKLKTGWIS